jgi:hypothetical protein
MATLGVRSAIAHAAVDEGFRRNLLADPVSACRTAGYEVSETEISAIANLAEDSFGTGFYAAQSLPDLFQNTHGVVEGLAPLNAAGELEEQRAV